MFLRVLKVNTDLEISACFDVMHHLRPHIVEEGFVEKVRRQYESGYKIIYVTEGASVASLAGFRVLETMAWGKILYIDDLITHPRYTKRGYAKDILDWLCELAKNKLCDEVHLDSGYQRNDAHRLYLNKGFLMTSHHFSKRVDAL